MAARGVAPRDARMVLEFVRQKFSTPEEVALGFGPQIVDNWDWLPDRNTTIVWEEGPYEWAIEVSEYVRQEYPWSPELVPFFIEPYNSFALCIWPK